MIVVVLLFLISAPFIWWYGFVLRKYKSLDNIPGPKPLPLLGNATDLGNTPQDFYVNLMKINAQYGNIFKIYVANELRVFIANPDLIKTILTSNTHITKSDGYKLASDWLNDGLLLSTGSKWKMRRKMITKSFHFQVLENFVETFNSCGDILVERLSSQGGEGSFDIYPYISLCAFDVVCRTSLGMKQSSQKENSHEFCDTVRGYVDIGIERFFSPWERFDLLFQLFSKKAKVNSKYLKFLHNYAQKAIRKRRDDIINEDTKKIFVNEDGTSRKFALIDMLLESEKTYNLSMEDIEEEINTILFAGHDTTSSTLAFMMLALANNPVVQEQVYQEIVNTVEDTKNISIQDLQRLKYLDLVVKESQRQYTTVPFIERRLESDWRIDGYSFPKDTILTLFIYGLHHDKIFYPDPYKFDPDRFLHENQSSRHIYSYVPFSAGPRNCVGQKFALLSVKTIISKILKSFRVVAVDGFEPKLGMAAALKSYNGVCIKLEQR